MIQSYLQIEDGFESRLDLSGPERRAIISQLMRRAETELSLSLNDQGNRTTATLITVVLYGEPGPFLGKKVLVWADGGSEEVELQFDKKYQLIMNMPAVVRRPGR